MRRKLNILCVALALLIAVVAVLWVRSNATRRAEREALIARVEAAQAATEDALNRAHAQIDQIERAGRTAGAADLVKLNTMVAESNRLMAERLKPLPAFLQFQQKSHLPYGRILIGLFALLYVLIFYGDWLRNRERGRIATGLCPACGYGLRGSPDRCPECGTTDMKLPLQPEQTASS